MERPGQQHQPEEPRFDAEERLGDAAAIESGIWDAEQFERPIDDATARRIASQLHGGQRSALYSLASSGALPDGLAAELAALEDNVPDECRTWPGHLRDYLEQRGDDRGPRERWASLTDGGPDDVHAARIAAHRERRANRALFERYVALGVNPEDAETAVEYQALQPRAATDASTDSVTDSPAETLPSQPPRIFLSDASPGLPPDTVRGVWLDAAVDESELQHAVQELLRTSPAAGPSAYRVAAAVGFEGFQVDVHESLATVARVAQGVAEHGRAFVAYLQTWGATQEAVDDFSRYYLGTYPSLAHWASLVAEERGWWDLLNEQVPSELLPHLRIDYEHLARELTYDYHVVEDEDNGHVYVFRLQP